MTSDAISQPTLQLNNEHTTHVDENGVPEFTDVRIQAPPRQRIGVVVTARNYGQFLGDCLRSVLAQTTKPHEIIYADDGSDDDSLQVAQRFTSENVKVLALPHQGVVAARNCAVEQTRADLLLHVDGDNMLAPDFIERQLEALFDGAAFAYCGKQYFGRSGRRWEPPAWNRDELWLGNFADTSSLVRRELFDAAGRWQDTTADTMWDWDLWLRVSRFGPGVRSDGLLYYRQHADNWSAQRRKNGGGLGRLKGLVRRATARVAVCCVFSGRLPALFPKWLEAVAVALDGAGREKPELFIIDDSPQGFWNIVGPDLSRLGDAFRAVRVDRLQNSSSWAVRRPDRTATARFLSAIYNRYLTETSSEVLWFIEDDIVVPPESGTRLLQLLLDGDEPKAAVTGLYKSRHEERFVLSNIVDGRVTYIRHPPDTFQPCDIAGTGCLMVFRPLAKASFQPFWSIGYNGKPVPAHDWHYSWQLRESGNPVWIHPDVICRHFINETEWV